MPMVLAFILFLWTHREVILFEFIKDKAFAAKIFFSTDIERILHGFGVSVLKAEKQRKSNFDIYDLTLSSGTKISKIESMII